MFLAFKAFVEKQSGHQILQIRSDNGKEYVNNKFINFCIENGIRMQHIVPYTPQQNGVAERKNRTLKEMANYVKGYRIIPLKSKNVIIRRDVKFVENISTYEPSLADVPPLSIPSTSKNISSLDDDSEDDNPSPPYQDPPSTPQLPKWVRATRDVAEASGYPDWDAAMNEEYHSLLGNDTWDLVPLPKGPKLVRCKWVYRTKYGLDGKVDKHKARLVAKVFSQIEGIDYTETFSLVAEMNSTCLVISLAASFR
eukprot:PITA_23566